MQSYALEGTEACSACDRACLHSCNALRGNVLRGVSILTGHFGHLRRCCHASWLRVQSYEKKLRSTNVSPIIFQSLHASLQRCSVAVREEGFIRPKITSIFIYIYKYRIQFWLFVCCFWNCNAATLQHCTHLHVSFSGILLLMRKSVSGLNFSSIFLWYLSFMWKKMSTFAVELQDNSRKNFFYY